MLVLPGVMLTAAAWPWSIAPLFDVPFDVALMVGAVLAATDPAILIPLFDRLGLRPKVAQTVIAESAFNDPTATVLALAIAGVVASGDVSLSTPDDRLHARAGARRAASACWRGSCWRS